MASPHRVNGGQQRQQQQHPSIQQQQATDLQQRQETAVASMRNLSALVASMEKKGETKGPHYEKMIKAYNAQISELHKINKMKQAQIDHFRRHQSVPAGGRGRGGAGWQTVVAAAAAVTRSSVSDKAGAGRLHMHRQIVPVLVFYRY